MATEPDEIGCTAFETSATTDRNTLFTPPCACPRCAPAESFEDDTPNTIWLRNDGRLVRHTVENMDLSAAGHELLG